MSSTARGGPRAPSPAPSRSSWWRGGHGSGEAGDHQREEHRRDHEQQVDQSVQHQREAVGHQLLCCRHQLDRVGQERLVVSDDLELDPVGVERLTAELGGRGHPALRQEVETTPLAHFVLLDQWEHFRVEADEFIEKDLVDDSLGSLAGGTDRFDFPGLFSFPRKLNEIVTLTAADGFAVLATGHALLNVPGVESEGPLASALAGKDFLASWEGKSVADLFEKTHTTMPATAPGTLTPAQAADIVAYMLAAGKYPAGAAELDSKVEALQRFADQRAAAASPRHRSSPGTPTPPRRIGERSSSTRTETADPTSTSRATSGATTRRW